MNIQSAGRDSLSRLRRTAKTQLQQTFTTPSDQLPAFVKGILIGGPVNAASLVVKAVIFEPKHLHALLTSHGLPLEYGGDLSVRADGSEESEALLTAALGDAVDFFYAPEPRRFVLYADHDDCTTVFASRKGHVAKIAAALRAQGFKEMDGFVRTFNRWGGTT